MTPEQNNNTTPDVEPDTGPVADAESASEATSHPADGPESWNLDALPPELDYFRSSEAYQVELTGFQGPMDLLLHLIDRDQVDIYAIPISRITDQFITHIEVMQTISLDKAGEFIAMAATLMVIKMKMLMPSHGEDGDEDEEDPRAELVRRLLEYKRFKEAAESLHKAERDRQQYHTRQVKFPFTDELDLEPKLRIEMFDLLSALAGIFDRVQSKAVHDVVREPFTVEEKMSLIEEMVGGGGTVSFEELFVGDSMKMEVIVTFIAVLELVKRGRLEFLQTDPLGPIWIQRPGVREETDEEASAETHDLTVLDEDHADEDLDATSEYVEDLRSTDDDPDEDTDLRELETEI